MQWTSRPLYPLCLLLRVASGMRVATTRSIISRMMLHRVLISQQWFLQISFGGAGVVACTLARRHSLASGLRFAHTEFLRDETVLDYLVNVFFFGERSLAADV